MANNAQPPAIATAIYNAVGVWVTELPITPERILRALDAKAEGKGEPRREGKVVRFDEEISLGANAARRRVHAVLGVRVTSPFRTWNGVRRTRSTRACT